MPNNIKTDQNKGICKCRDDLEYGNSFFFGFCLSFNSGFTTFCDTAG